MSNTLEGYLKQGAGELGIQLDSIMMEQFRAYYELLMEENQKYNLTSIKGEKEVAVKHFLDSLTCVQFLEQEPLHLMDIGTGAGFPGVPLKILMPKIKLVLVDSVRKKVEFLEMLITKLGFSDAQARWDRAEIMGNSVVYREKSDVVVSRAVASLNVLAELCLPLVRPGGLFLAMKGPGAHEEAETAQKAIKLLGGVIEKVEARILPFIPEERNLILMRKENTTPNNYPRRPGIPAKKPIV